MASETAVAEQDLVLTPPEPVKVVAPEKAAGLVPVDDGKKTELEARVDSFIDDLVAQDVSRSGRLVPCCARRRLNLSARRRLLLSPRVARRWLGRARSRRAVRESKRPSRAVLRAPPPESERAASPSSLSARRSALARSFFCTGWRRVHCL